MLPELVIKQIFSYFGKKDYLVVDVFRDDYPGLVSEWLNDKYRQLLIFNEKYDWLYERFVEDNLWHFG